MFVFPQRVDKMSLFFCSCFASSKRPQLREVGDPHVLFFVQSRAAPACEGFLSSFQGFNTCLQQWCSTGKWNLPRFSYLNSAMWVMSLRDAQVWHTLEIGQEICIAWQKQDTHPSCTACDLCARAGHTKEPLRLLCQDRCWCSSYSHCSFLHENRARAEPVAMPKPLWRHLYQQAKVQFYFLHKDWDPHRFVCPWLNCSLYPDFPWENLILGVWRAYAHKPALQPHMPLKLEFQAPTKKLIKKSEAVGLFCFVWRFSNRVEELCKGQSQDFC